MILDYTIPLRGAVIVLGNLPLGLAIMIAHGALVLELFAPVHSVCGVYHCDPLITLRYVGASPSAILALS